MGIATDMKKLAEDIVTSHDLRVNALGHLVKDTHKMLRGFDADRKRMSKEQAGDLALGRDHGAHWCTGDMLPPELSEVAFSMEIDAVSGIIETQYGFHIVKVLKREPAGRKGLLEVITEIENTLLREAIERHYQVWLEELRKRYPIKVNYDLVEQKKNAHAND